MARRRKRRGKRSSRSGQLANLGWILAIFAVAAVVAGAGYMAARLQRDAVVDEATLCHGSSPAGMTMVLLDLTDPLGATQTALLRARLAAEIRKVPENTMISIGVVSEFPESWGVRFARCKPASGADANMLYQNPKLIAARYEREFVTPFNQMIEQLISGEAENKSPIMEGLQALVTGTPYFGRSTGPVRLVVVSDMLQHSDVFSFYRGQNWDDFTRSNNAKRLARNLDGVDVLILRIPRTGGNTPDQVFVDDFWSRYFDLQGSRPPSVVSLGDL